MAHQGKLPYVNRFITTHDPQTGKAVFSKALQDESVMQGLSDDMGFALSYATTTFPVDTSGDVDIKNYKHYLEDAPGLVIYGGTVLRHVDFQPGKTSAMHRTMSLDYGIVLEGEIEAVLDSGETRRLQRGDVCIQRGTMHAWRNPSNTEWCRMVFILQPCKPIEHNGQKYEEDLRAVAHEIRESTEHTKQAYEQPKFEVGYLCM
jgi:quercetin dioxygenase-like cupin family protein